MTSGAGIRAARRELPPALRWPLGAAVVAAAMILAVKVARQDVHVSVHIHATEDDEDEQGDDAEGNVEEPVKLEPGSPLDRRRRRRQAIRNSLIRTRARMRLREGGFWDLVNSTEWLQYDKPKDANR